MASAIMNKVWNLFGMDQAEDEELEEDVYDYDYEEEQPVEEKKSFIKRNSKVVSMPQSQSVRMVISQPTNFEQSEEICGFLKEKKSGTTSTNQEDSIAVTQDIYSFEVIINS